MWSLKSNQDLGDVIKIVNNQKLVTSAETVSEPQNYHFYLIAQSQISEKIVHKEEFNLTVGNIEIIDQWDQTKLLFNNGNVTDQLKAVVHGEGVSQDVTWALEDCSVKDAVTITETGKIVINTSAPSTKDKDVKITVSAASVDAPHIKATHTHTFHIYSPIGDINIIAGQTVLILKGISSTTDWEMIYKKWFGDQKPMEIPCIISPDNYEDIDDTYWKSSWNKNYWCQLSLSWSNDGGLLQNNNEWDFGYLASITKTLWQDPSFTFYNTSKNTTYFHFTFDGDLTPKGAKTEISDIRFTATNRIYKGTKIISTAYPKVTFYDVKAVGQ